MTNSVRGEIAVNLMEVTLQFAKLDKEKEDLHPKKEARVKFRIDFPIPTEEEAWFGQDDYIEIPLPLSSAMYDQVVNEIRQYFDNQSIVVI